MKKPAPFVVSKDSVRAPGIGKALTPPAGKKLDSFKVVPKFVPDRSTPKSSGASGKRGR